jgi:hypothetical protein
MVYIRLRSGSTPSPPFGGSSNERTKSMALNDEDMTTAAGGDPEGPADSGAGEGAPGEHDGGADGGAEGPADSGAGEGTPGVSDGGADGGADSGAS